MSGGAVVIIIGGGTQQNRSATDEPQVDDSVRIRLTQEVGETAAMTLRRAADVLDGVP